MKYLHCAPPLNRAKIPPALKFILTNPSKILDLLPPLDGVVAQLVERLNGIQEVRGSNPLGSTILAKAESWAFLKPRRKYRSISIKPDL